MIWVVWKFESIQHGQIILKKFHLGKRAMSISSVGLPLVELNPSSLIQILYNEYREGTIHKITKTYATGEKIL